MPFIIVLEIYSLVVVKAHFFGSTADQIQKSRNLLKARSPSGPVVHDSKNIKRNGFQPPIKPKPKKKPNPFKSQIHVYQSNTNRFKIIQKKRGKMAPT